MRPEGIRGVCEDYCAGATEDTPAPFDPLAIWRRWAPDVTGHGLDAGHFLRRSGRTRSPPRCVS